jgi:hypothetical protein
MATPQRTKIASNNLLVTLIKHPPTEHPAKRLSIPEDMALVVKAAGPESAASPQLTSSGVASIKLRV